MSNAPRRDRRIKRGLDVLQDPVLNKSTAFTEEERDGLGIRGLLPPRVFTQDEQTERVLGNFHRKTSDLEKYIFLTALQDRNERLFYRVVTDNIEEMLPIIYTPTVGEASVAFAQIFRRARGLYVSADDRGSVAEILRNWPQEDVRVIVVTDGERILGLGDLGASGMGIPVGKLALYTACGGVDPGRCLPVMLDVGTENERLLDDPLYLGLPRPRIRGEEYYALVEEFVTGVQEVFPRALIQFEDFLTPTAYELLRRYHDRVLCFNDDIQGTASVALAGLIAAMRITGQQFADQTVLFVGAGSAATGIADLLVPAFMRHGMSEHDARRRCWFADLRGLVVAGRDDLQPHNLPYAHEHAPTDVEDAIDALRPTAIIGATGHPGAFTATMLGKMAAINQHPIVFALSNPTSKAECTADQAYEWTDGRCVFASGSPFPPVSFGGKTFRPGQGNNAYIFPGVGLGAVACGATRVTDGMFHAAAEALAGTVTETDLAAGAIYPPLDTLREVSVQIAVAVAETAYAAGLTLTERPDDVESMIRGEVYSVEYGPSRW